MNQLVQDYLVGTDFEVFVQDKETGEIVSAEGLVKGTKHEPFSFDPDEKWYATSLDNVLAEGTIPPTNVRECFVQSINKTLGFIQSILPPHLCTTSIPSAILNEKHLLTENAKLFGCESDLNVWLRCINEKPVANNLCLRSAGTHVHLSYKNPNMDITEKMVKIMDLYLSVPSLIIEPENERRKLYGKAGAFRIKDYGFEHRVLSGYFTSTDDLKGWVFDNTIRSIDFINNERFEELEAVGEIIQTAINSNDKVLAGNLIRQFEIPLP